jgi:glycosyltransferase involved in cell wall biosynthesis
MTVAFIYDHRYYTKNKTVFSSGAFTSTSWERYLNHFEELTVVGNLENIKEVNHHELNPCNHPKVDFQFVPAINSATGYLSSFFTDSQELKDIIKQHDACIIRMPGLLSANAIKICKKLNKPFAVEAVGCPWDAYWNYGKIQAKAIAPLAFWQMKKWLAKSPMVLYVTKEFLQGRYPTPGISTNASNVMLPKMEQNILEARLGHLKKNGNQKKLIFGTVGKIDFKTKGHHIAIEALAEYKKHNPNFIWKVVGPGDKSYLNSLIKKADLEENVEIVGKLSSGDAMMDFYDNIDVLIHPSLQEGLPRTVIEAMSRATPVLASSIAGIPELLPNEYLHKPGKHSQLLQQLTHISNNQQGLQKMATENFEKAKEYQAVTLQKRRFDFFSKLRKMAEK